MEGLERSIKLGLALLAGLLMMGMLALGGLVVANASFVGGVSTLFAASRNPGQIVVATDTSAVKNVAAPDTPTATAQQAAPAQQTQPQSGVVDARFAAKKAGPAVVTVVNTLSSTGRGRFGSPGTGQPAPEALGSGVIIDSQGDIITNQHVVANQQSLQVIFSDGTQVPATLVGGDVYSDIAVIKVSAKVPAVAQFGNSDTLEPGQPVVAIGTALGNYNNTVTEGIVSALHRKLGDGSTSTQDLIQTDAAINHGNSGGPLLDLNGNVMGINTAVVRSDGTMGDVAEGLGFAIPSNTAMAVANQLMKSGTIAHPFIGISYQVITPDIATQYKLSRQQGLLVTDVVSGSPAEKAGIKPNSIITKFDGVQLGSGANTTGSGPTLVELLGNHKVGDSVKITMIAPGSNTETDVTVVLAARPDGQ